MHITASTRVVGKEGLTGVIESVAQAAPGTPAQALIRLDTGQKILISTALLSPQDDGHYYLPVSMAEIHQYQPSNSAQEETIVVPLAVEEMDVQKQKIETGKVRLTKIVQQHEEIIDEPLLREDVEVRRVPINQIIDSPVQVRYEGETMIVPLMEEVLVVEKRLMLKEEVHLIKHQRETRDPQRVVLRSEEAIIEREDSAE